MNIDTILKWATPVLLLLIFLFGSNIVRADEHAGKWYFGGGPGLSQVDECTRTAQRWRRDYEGGRGERPRPSIIVSCSGEDELSWNFIFGNSRLIGLSDNILLGFEVGYSDLGETISTEVDAVSFTPILRVAPFPNWNLLVKGGPAWTDGSNDDWDEVVGIGLERVWPNAFARAGWDRYFDVLDSDDIDNFTLLVGYRW